MRKTQERDARVEDKPCDGCPWLKKNQTPKAVRSSPIDGAGRH